MLKCGNENILIGRKPLCSKETAKKIILFCVMMICCTAAIFAEDLAPAQMTTLVSNLKETLQGNLGRSIIGLCAVGTGIALAVNKDSQRMKAAGIAVIIGGVIVMAGPDMVDKLMKSNS